MITRYKDGPLPAPFLNRDDDDDDDEIRSRIARESLTFALKVYDDTHLVYYSYI